MKLGVICDGISRDLTRAIDVMDGFDLTYAELQFVGKQPPPFLRWRFFKLYQS